MKAEVAALTKLIGEEETKKLVQKAMASGLPPDLVEKTLHDLLTNLLAGGVMGRDNHVARALRYKTEPVSVKEFLHSPFYLNKADTVYPAILVACVELNSGKYDEAVLTGGIGSGKTTIALYSQAYQLYLLSCLRSPHTLFGLDTSSEIKVVFQNIQAKLAKEVDYARFRELVEESPYFQRHFMFDKELSSKLMFPNRIEIAPISGSETASIGQNIIGGIIDEVNFMAVVKNSKQASDGGTYNQAVELYNSIARRRKSRFMSAGTGLPGLICIVSSKKVPGQFTDIKEEEAKRNPRIFVYDKRVWDIKPDNFCGATFPVFVGDAGRKPRLITPSDKFSEDDHARFIDHIPTEFTEEFRDDITKSLRDIAGRSTLAVNPYMPNLEKVVANFGKYDCIVLDEWIDFQQKRTKLLPERIKNKQYPRYAHIDLAITGDSAGLCIGHVAEFREVKRGTSFEMLPVISIDLVMEIKPPPNGEIEFYRIREFLYKLTEYGMPLRWISLDSFQSRDSIQLMRQQGYSCGLVSMDVSMQPYDTLKEALYDGRVNIPEHAKLRHELATLEIDYKRNKVDHNSHGSKDISDALAGVVYGLTTRREIWGQHSVVISKVYETKQFNEESTT